jgi:hypothetical protein
MAKIETIKQCVKMIDTAYEDFALTEDQIRLWVLMTNEIPDELLKAGTIQLINTYQYKVPKIADLKEAIKQVQQLALEEVTTPAEAFGIATRAISTYGHRREPEMPPLVMQAIKSIGGWREFCLSTNMESMRYRFMQAYEQLNKRLIEDTTRPEAITSYVEQQKQITAGTRQVLASWTCR